MPEFTRPADADEAPLPSRASQRLRPAWGWVVASAVLLAASLAVTAWGYVRGLRRLRPVYGQVTAQQHWDAVDALARSQLGALPLAALAILAAGRGRLQLTPIVYAVVALAAFAYLASRFILGR